MIHRSNHSGNRNRLAPRLILTLILSILSSLAAPASLATTNICERHLAIAAKKHAVPIAILHAVGLTESGRKGRLHPYALNVEGKTYFAGSRRNAIAIFSRETAKGRKLIDLGCMQINHKYHSHQFASLEQMFEPAANVDYAARFLRRLRKRHGSWVLAVARYHAGDRNHAAQQKYVCRVLDHMIGLGLARATPSTRNVCGGLGR